MNANSEREFVVVVIFGGKVIDGRIEGTNTDDRCRFGFELARVLEEAGKTVIIAVTGGLDHPSSTRPTAELMSDRLRELGWTGKLITEPTALNTHESIRNIKRVLRPTHAVSPDWWQYQMYVVSERFHTFRIWYSFLWFGKWVLRTPTPHRLETHDRLMEHLYLLVHFVDPWGLIIPPLMSQHRRIQAGTEGE